MPTTFGIGLYIMLCHMGSSGSNMNQYTCIMSMSIAFMDVPYADILISQVVEAGASTKYQITLEDIFVDATILHNNCYYCGHYPTIVVCVV